MKLVPLLLTMLLLSPVTNAGLLFYDFHGIGENDPTPGVITIGGRITVDVESNSYVSMSVYSNYGDRYSWTGQKEFQFNKYHDGFLSGAGFIDASGDRFGMGLWL